MNPRPNDYESFALPTELPQQLNKKFYIFSIYQSIGSLPMDTRKLLVLEKGRFHGNHLNKLYHNTEALEIVVNI